MTPGWPLQDALLDSLMVIGSGLRKRSPMLSMPSSLAWVVVNVAADINCAMERFDVPQWLPGYQWDEISASTSFGLLVGSESAAVATPSSWVLVFAVFADGPESLIFALGNLAWIAAWY